MPDKPELVEKPLALTTYSIVTKVEETYFVAFGNKFYARDHGMTVGDRIKIIIIKENRVAAPADTTPTNPSN